MTGILDKVVKALRDPRRAWLRLRLRLWGRVRARHDGWTEGPVRRRVYRDYGHYVRHQRSKLKFRRSWAEQMDGLLREALAERIGDDCAGKRVLCLAARLGGEVRAFREKGAFAFGIDLNPGTANPCVVFGDFHALDIPDDAVDLVYTNSLDHSLHLDRVMAEAKRVLVPDGTFIVEAMSFADNRPGYWESTTWSDSSELTRLIKDAGFALEDEFPIDRPWLGTHMRFSPAAGRE